MSHFVNESDNLEDVKKQWTNIIMCVFFPATVGYSSECTLYAIYILLVVNINHTYVHIGLSKLLYHMYSEMF